MRRSSRKSASYSSLAFWRSATGMPISRTATVGDSGCSPWSSGCVNPMRSKRKLPSETLTGVTGKSTGSSNQTIFPPSTACTPQSEASVLNKVRPRPVAASRPYSFMDGNEGLPSATSTRIRSDRMCRVTHIDVSACSTAFVTSSDVNRAAQLETSAGRSRRCAATQCRATGVLSATGSRCAKLPCHPVSYPQAGGLSVSPRNPSS